MGNYMFCESLAEAIELEAKAKAEAEELLNEMPCYIKTPGVLSIEIIRKFYPFSKYAIEADLLYDGEIVKHYEAFDLLELDLVHLQMKAILNGRKNKEA